MQLCVHVSIAISLLKSDDNNSHFYRHPIKAAKMFEKLKNINKKILKNKKIRMQNFVLYVSKTEYLKTIAIISILYFQIGKKVIKNALCIFA